ncbi:MoxR family ATPase [uncultured Thiodictyon sp.]|uniref:AAA family ATPase n=1 Tax=uncultured Thiodictyon sp. TaxID=1846217 RepID=UPI003457E9FB
MTDPLAFVRHQDRPLDWDRHDRKAARAALSGTIDMAAARRLDQGARRFQPPPELVAAINAALASRSPLLLTGEPGTGKTETAFYLSEYFGLSAPYHFQVRSDSSARDLRYDFDAVAYLQDAYAKAIGTPADGSDPRAQPRYLKKGMLWLAYESEDECVLLIDEIDKAPRDFPNDLLQELSDQCFAHPFGGAPVRNQGPPPIVVITSNGERSLPDPFLRRCVICHIELDDALLGRILDAWESAFAPGLGPELGAAALAGFKKVRGALKERGRPPGAAGLLLWCNVLAVQQFTAADLATGPLADLPGIVCLVKVPEDYQLLGRPRR